MTKTDQFKEMETKINMLAGSVATLILVQDTLLSMLGHEEIISINQLENAISEAAESKWKESVFVEINVRNVAMKSLKELRAYRQYLRDLEKDQGAITQHGES